MRKVPSHSFEMRPVFFSAHVMDVISIYPLFTNAHSTDIYDILTGAGKTGNLVSF